MRERSAPPAGWLFIIGGALRPDNEAVWSRLVQLSADYAVALGEPSGTRPRIAVLPTAAFSPLSAGERAAEILARHGADPQVVPIAVVNAPREARAAVRDPELVATLRRSHGVYFTGGQQARIMAALLSEEGTPTPALEAIWEVYRRGGVVAGTSAGAAVMSRVMCRDVSHQVRVLENGVAMGREIDTGLGFLDERWFVDQHFIIRGRIGRALAVTRHVEIPYGLGVDENTALVVHAGAAEVVGYRGALLLDLSKATHDARRQGFNIQNVRLSYLDQGDWLDMQTLELTPADDKRAAGEIDPGTPEFRPTSDDPLFTTEILANSAILDLMRRLMQNRHSRAIGLAFEHAQARTQSVPAFEFQLIRDERSRAWPPAGRDEYTISNVRLEVRRVELDPIRYK